MWPFSKKIDLYGFRTDENGRPVFDFTAEERRAIDGHLSMVQGMAILEGYQDRVRNLTMARALSEYATDQAYLAAQESSKREHKLLVNKAVSAAFKACNIYSHPILDYDLACFSMMADRMDVAAQLFRKFLAEQPTFNADQLDNKLIEGRDVDAAITHAREIVD
jgi:hypothetical protein